MESRVKGYKLVPQLDGCRFCTFDKGKFMCRRSDIEILDCNYFDAIYVPSYTAIEVPKQQSEKQ